MNWLILRGLIRESRHWGPFYEKLQAKVSPARVIALDYPGFGQENERPSPASIEQIMLDVRSRYLAQKQNEDFSVMAVSLGGMVLMKWAELFPKDFKKWVIVNSSARGLSPIHERMMPKNLPLVFKQVFSSDPVKREFAILKHTTGLREDELKARAELHAQFLKDRPYKKINGVKQLLAASRFRAPEALNVQAHVIVGRGDTLVSPICSEKIAQKYGFTLLEHPTANHDLAADDPDWLADQLSKICHS